MKSILISDITLRESGKPNGYTLSFKEKIEIAKKDNILSSVVNLLAKSENMYYNSGNSLTFLSLVLQGDRHGTQENDCPL